VLAHSEALHKCCKEWADAHVAWNLLVDEKLSLRIREMDDALGIFV